MHRTLLSAALFAAIAFSAGSAQAASFTYHGNLQDAGKPADGSYDLALTLYSSPKGGKVIAGPLVMYKVPVHEGTFSTEADFGQLTDVSGQSWLGVAVRNAGKGDFAALSARAPISAAETETNSSCPGSWSLDGNAGNPGGAYLGTADAKDLILESNGIAVMYAPQAASGAVALSGAFHSTAGEYSTAVSKSNSASGTFSFAGGFSAGTVNDGSFVWGDDTAHKITDSGPNQFIVQAGGGAAINGTPKNSGVELSVYPNGNSGNYSNMFFGLANQTAGVLTSAGDASSATSNDASFYFDDYNGTAATQTRMLTIAPGTITIGGISTSSQLTMLPQGATAKMVLSTVGTQVSDMSFGIFKVPTAGGRGTSLLNFNPTGVMSIYNATAEKPGGGMWTAPSDRRIKQDISPIHDALDTVMKLRPVNFRYTPEYRAMEGGLTDRPYAGFIAQEYAEVFPTDVISTGKHVPGAAKSDPTIFALDPNAAFITTVAAVQELAVQAQDRDGEVAKLRGENAELRSKLDKVLVRLNKLEAGKGR